VSYRAALALVGEHDERRAAILERIGDTERARGTSQAAVDAYDAALRHVPEGDGHIRISVKIAGTVGRYEATHSGAMTLAESAVAALEPRGDAPALVDALIALGWMRLLALDPEGAGATAARALALSRSLDLPKQETSGHVIMTRALWLGGDHTAVPPASDVDRLATRLGDDDEVPGLRWLQAMGLMRNGEVGAALAIAEQGLAVARRVGSLDGELQASEPAIWALSVLGRYSEAIALGESTLRTAERIGQRWPRAWAEHLMSLVLGGATERFLEIASEIPAEAPSNPPRHVQARLYVLSGLLALGRCGEVSADALVRERPSCKTCEVTWLSVDARREALCGDPQVALESADRFQRHVEETRFRYHAPAADHVRALAFTRLARADDAGRAAERARSAYAALESVAGPDLLGRELNLASWA
jgi:hypothetical protein